MSGEYKSFYKEVGGNEGALCWWNKRLDTYGKGCQHDCDYCYAKSLLEFRGMWDAQRPAQADPEKIVRKIWAMKKRGTWPDVVRLGGMTDCFQPIERTERVTYKTIERLNEAETEYLIVTKSDLVASDEYTSLMDKTLAHVQVTITSDDKHTAAQHERASTPEKRKEAVEKLQAEGFDVSVRLSPYVPEWVDVDWVNDIKCDKLLVEFLRVSPLIRRTCDVDLTPYTHKHAGYMHLPLNKKIALLSRLHFQQMSVCDDVPEHAEWFRSHFNANPEDCCNLRRPTRARHVGA